MPGAGIEVEGLRPLVAQLKGPMFKQVNQQLRVHARGIAKDLTPHVAAAVSRSGAPQAHAMAGTVRPHSDRVPVVVVGKTNPRFAEGFRHAGEGAGSTRRRRGSMAHGVVYGPLGGRRDTRAAENYYRIGRDSAGGHLGRALREDGAVFERAADLYLAAFLAVMDAHGFHRDGTRKVAW